MTTANIITFVRILLIPVFMVAALCGTQYANIIALAIFIIASITDWVDGHIARKYKQVTTLGKFLDPLADKLLVTSAILIFVQNGVMGAVPATIIIAREFAVTSLRIVAMGEGIALAANMSGKIKTVVQIATIILLFMPFSAKYLFAGVTIGNIA
ncbi:MAG: CDP-diacylglycerol--glycerol-3-phosphate 3-phosphatidyltransferase, partial [Oscillospiraceae bacterium]